MNDLTLTVESDDLEKLNETAQELGGQAGGEKIKSEMGFAIMQVLRAHFSKLAQDTTHHQSASSLGADRTGFYEKAREGTREPEVDGEGVSITIEAQGLVQRLFGGTITATKTKFLTIPALAVAYGKRAREFDLRFILFGDTGLAALVSKAASPANEGDVYYWLVRSVTQKGDPTVMPTDEEMVDAAQENAAAFIETAWGENK